MRGWPGSQAGVPPTGVVVYSGAPRSTPPGEPPELSSFQFRRDLLAHDDVVRASAVSVSCYPLRRASERSRFFCPGSFRKALAALALPGMGWAGALLGYESVVATCVEVGWPAFRLCLAEGLSPDFVLFDPLHPGLRHPRVLEAVVVSAARGAPWGRSSSGRALGDWLSSSGDAGAREVAAEAVARLLCSGGLARRGRQDAPVDPRAALGFLSSPAWARLAAVAAARRALGDWSAAPSVEAAVEAYEISSGQCRRGALLSACRALRESRSECHARRVAREAAASGDEDETLRVAMLLASPGFPPLAGLDASTVFAVRVCRLASYICAQEIPAADTGKFPSGE